MLRSVGRVFSASLKNLCSINNILDGAVSSSARAIPELVRQNVSCLLFAWLTLVCLIWLLRPNKKCVCLGLYIISRWYF